MYPFAGSGLLLARAARLRHTSASMTLNVANTTGSIVAFTLTGAVEVMALWGEVTTVVSSNATAAFFRINDQGATVDVTLNTGVTLSSAPVGSIISRTGLVTGALTLKSSAAGAFQDANSAGNDVFTPFSIVKKTGAVTTLDFRYTTTNNPSSGVILWNVLWIPLSADGNIS